MAFFGKMRQRKSDAAYTRELMSKSILSHAANYETTFSGQNAQWNNAYGVPDYQSILKSHSVWLSTYPDSFITQDGQSVLQSMGSLCCLKMLHDLGIGGLHTNPLKRAGAITPSGYLPSVDGHFDRIELTIDPAYGQQADYTEFTANAKAQNINIIGDIIPGHTGKGPDFRLAEKNAPGYLGIYNMIEIEPRHWSALPDIQDGADSQNLKPEQAEILRSLGYTLIGPLDVEIFIRPGIKETSWSATAEVTGLDGVKRRWVYLHIFKEGQPSLNWLDPSLGAYRLITTDALHSLKKLGAAGLRLDATMFLGIESGAGNNPAWLGGHPLSSQVINYLGMLIRKFGGFSFQELNTDLKTMALSLAYGPEFNYDFPTRPAYLYALVMQDAGPLRLSLREMLTSDIQPNRLVHGLQNHDELMLEAMHFSINGDQTFQYENVSITGEALFEKLYQDVIARTTGLTVPYNLPFSMSPGVCSTLPGLIAASLGISDLSNLTPEQIERIKEKHLLVASYNALQGGVFMMSGWDLIGALPVSQDEVASFMVDNDARWINRGAYDLCGKSPQAMYSKSGLPRAASIYGSLKDQEGDTDSFCSRLSDMIASRQASNIASCNLVGVPQVKAKSALIMVHQLPDDFDTYYITAINFADAAIVEEIEFELGLSSAELIWAQRTPTSRKHVLSLSGQDLKLELDANQAILVKVNTSLNS